MNIIELAKQAGIVIYPGTQSRVLWNGDIDLVLTRFAHLVRAEVLEEAAVVIEQAAIAYVNPVWAQEITSDIRDMKEKT